jgi:hypothetical protein
MDNYQYTTGPRMKEPEYLTILVGFCLMIIFLLLYVFVIPHAPKFLWIVSSHEHSFCEFFLRLSFSINRKLFVWYMQW